MYISVSLGPRGLAWSYAFVVWIGLWLLMASYIGILGFDEESRTRNSWRRA